MSASNTKAGAIAKAGCAALAGLVALATAAPVLAQPAPYGANTGQDRTGYYYDACKRDQTSRGTVGAVLGGGAGAVIGSNAAARNARTEGALLGGLLGAIAGGVVGNKSAACTTPDRYYTNNEPPLPPPPPLPPRADTPYYERDAYADRAAADARDDAWRPREPERRVTDRTPTEDCTLAESPIYMPDGRTQTRFVRVCRDASGKYAVVD